MENIRLKAENFAKKYNVSLEILSKFKEKSEWDNLFHWKFKCKLKRDKKSYTFIFTQSLVANDKEPNIYDILACLYKYELGTFKEFCQTFGYEMYEPYKGTKNVKSYKIYQAVKTESKKVLYMFSDCLEELRQIW